MLNTFYDFLIVELLFWWLWVWKCVGEIDFLIVKSPTKEDWQCFLAVLIDRIRYQIEEGIEGIDFWAKYACLVYIGGKVS